VLAVFTAEEMRRLDQRAITELGIPGAVLMENAGRGAAQAIVSPRTFSRLKTDASRGGKASGSFTGMLRSAGPFNFFHANQIFAFIARKILGAK